MKWLLAIALIWFAWRYLKPAPKPARLTETQRARRLLGLRADADEGEIRAAHRRLVAEAHPDRGGSSEASIELNAARDLLLGALRRG
ncbi:MULTISPECIES: J domain-containing protein [Sphingomonas]|uniref:J domain-containing protein n=1 Tax=Sphingomonas kyungheensis TaxID=1069987 RepID=A0ABU8H649_9SPHN|nr:MULTISPECIES: J domain-containing protein [unclassified Sphingomonas]EZP54992.1 DnaJ domain protein [Sphingomonas sp. RIT328]